ncbi:MAG: RluA family pseudouridine synthase [Treponema sp.]
MDQQITLAVPALQEKLRADIFCSKMMDNMPRAKFKSGVRGLTVNGQCAKLSHIVQAGDCISFTWCNPIPEKLIPEHIPLDILYEDPHIIAINKKAGMVTHPAAGNWTGTLVQALAYYRLKDSPIIDDFARELTKEITADTKNFSERLRTGIVHRLDKDTSGVIITARHHRAEAFFKHAFKNRTVDKYYLALLSGVPAEKCGSITTAIFRDTKKRVCFAASSDLSKGKYSYSRYKVVKQYGNYTLVLFKIYTGRTHQIRLHAQYIGCPVFGDSLYGKEKAKQKPFGLMLHAYRITLPSYDEQLTGKKQTITAPVPRRFRRILRLLKENPHALNE